MEVQQEHQFLTDLYTAFNARDIARCLAGMTPDVTWANGMDGGYVHGHEGVRAYWTRQWKLVNPRVEPQDFQSNANKVMVDVHQVVRALDGTVIVDQMVKHIFTIESGLVKIFEIA
jgi:ketosteroid isomerase-like protein